jgi:hypothetical protein
MPKNNEEKTIFLQISRSHTPRQGRETSRKMMEMERDIESVRSNVAQNASFLTAAQGAYILCVFVCLHV